MFISCWNYNFFYLFIELPSNCTEWLVPSSDDLNLSYGSRLNPHIRSGPDSSMGLCTALYWLETELRPLSYQELISSYHWPQENWMRDYIWLSITLPPAGKQFQVPGLIAVSGLVSALESSTIKLCWRTIIP